MAHAAVGSGLMAHQKDEHDIWVCKDCGWKYPNAKPSPKIRKNHKKHCPGKAGTPAHAPGGSSDDASDDDHHPSVKGGVPPSETAPDAPVPQVESKSRDFDYSSASVKEDLLTASAEAGYGNAKEAPAHEDSPEDLLTASAEAGNGNAKEAPAHEDSATPAAVPVAASHGVLMPHQKDEHDIWICRECGWKYPNAKPSAKIRKNHKKHCPGKGGPVATGGSSDEASDDEHHHKVPAPTGAVKPLLQGSDLTASAAPEAPTNISREIDFAALKESPSPVISDDTPAAAAALDAGTGTGDATLTSPAATEPVGQEKAVPEEANTVAPETTVESGFMLHQKDENDVWICKDCGWKYPNAKPSAKIRKNHKKKCTEKAHRAGATGGSSDEASDDEHHHHPLSSPSPAAPAAPAALPPAVEAAKEKTAAAPEVPGTLSREIDFAALKESSNAAVESETTSASTAEATPAVAEAETVGDEAGKSTPAKDAGAVDAIDKEASKKPVSLQEAIDQESEKEKGSTTSAKSSDAAVGSGGLMLHQKDEADVWVCKDCGWKYPNAKPSAKIRKNHKKKCPGKAGSGAPAHGGSSDEASDDEHHSTAAEAGTGTDVKDSTPAAETVSKVPNAQVQSREFSFGSAVPTADADPAAETGVPAPVETEEPAKVAETQQAPATTIGGLMAHQKNEDDIWLCKECGWRYPNAKPSAKVRKNHKKKCPKKGGSAKGTDGGSSDGASSDDENKLKGGKCFPCL